MDKSTLKNNLCTFVAQYQAKYSTFTKWRSPLLAVASACDPLFITLKRVVSSSHALPKDLLPTARSVVAFFIPFEKTVAKSNGPGHLASEEWARAYIETNALIAEVGLAMKHDIETAGFAVEVTPPTLNLDSKMLLSNWSHRHVSYIAGLGKFGLNNMLITESGCCGRIGSFVTSLNLPADIRSEEEACLYRYNGSCQRCVKRCVGNAFRSTQFDRHKCYKVCLENEKKYEDIGSADVCGKCLVTVPCSLADPVKRRKEQLLHTPD